MKNISFIVTGASASGKSTLVNEAIYNGYTYLPSHMTRKPRPNEIPNKDAIFITNEEFEENFNNNIYLEESLDFAFLRKLEVYYGTPKVWINFLKNDNYCATPVSIAVASKIKELSNVYWIHLYCNEIDRYNRLISRGISIDEVEKRMSSGDSIYFPTKADIIVNTSQEKPAQILKKVRRI